METKNKPDKSAVFQSAIAFGASCLVLGAIIMHFFNVLVSSSLRMTTTYYYTKPELQAIC